MKVNEIYIRNLHSFGHVPRLLFLLISSSITPLMLL
jgi:hypothetical protein